LFQAVFFLLAIVHTVIRVILARRNRSENTPCASEFGNGAW
jgi:hypothetical protein